MEKVIELFKLIQNTGSTNAKKDIIVANKDNELFKKCLKFLLDGNVITGISDKKMSKMSIHKANTFSGKVLNSFEEVIDYLNVNNTGTDMDVATLRQFICNHAVTDDDCEFYEQMITKKFRLGADTKLVNKAIPGLIPVFDVQLGTPIEKVKLKGDEHIFLSRKLNGCRCAFVGDKCKTRQNKDYKGLDHIINDLIAMGYSNYFVDGELLYKNEEGLSDSEAFQKGTGIAMSKDGDKTQLKFVVFDILPLEEFWAGKSKEPYSVRTKYLNKLQERISEFKPPNIEVVERVYDGYDHLQIWKWLDYAETHDWEGICCNLDTPYECKRTKSLLKIKKFYSCDIKCTGIEEGSGRNKGTLGALVCEYKGYPVNVGSGFSDEQRRYYWEHPDEIVGHIISCKYKEETTNKDGGISIQFPVFEGVRFDKDEESYN